MVGLGLIDSRLLINVKANIFPERFDLKSEIKVNLLGP